MKVESSISWNINNILVLELESSTSWKKRTFFGLNILTFSSLDFKKRWVAYTTSLTITDNNVRWSLSFNIQWNLLIVDIIYNGQCLKLDCVKYGYNFIENSNILPENFGQDGLYLNNSVNCKLLNKLKQELFFKQTFYQTNISNKVLKGGNLHFVMKTISLLRVKLFWTLSIGTEHNDILDTNIGLR